MAALLFAAVALGASLAPEPWLVACQVQVDVDIFTGDATVIGCSGALCDDGRACLGPVTGGPGGSEVFCMCFTGGTPPSIRPRCSAVWDGYANRCDSYGCEETPPPIGSHVCMEYGWSDSDEGVTHWVGCECNVVP